MAAASARILLRAAWWVSTKAVLISANAFGEESRLRFVDDLRHCELADILRHRICEREVPPMCTVIVAGEKGATLFVELRKRLRVWSNHCDLAIPGQMGHEPVAADWLRV